MAEILIKVPHRFPITEALTRVKATLKRLQREHSHELDHFHAEWRHNTCAINFSSHGMDIHCHIAIQTDHVLVKGDAPWLARGQVEDLVRNLLQETLRNPKPTSVNKSQRQPPAAEKVYEDDDLLDFFNPFKVLQEMGKMIFGDW